MRPGGRIGPTWWTSRFVWWVTSAWPDMVQGIFPPAAGSRVGDIDDERGWLIVVTSRLCLDHIKSASTRERPQDIAAWHDGDASVSSVDPTDRVTLI